MASVRMGGEVASEVRRAADLRVITLRNACTAINGGVNKARPVTWRRSGCDSRAGYV